MNTSQGNNIKQQNDNDAIERHFLKVLILYTSVQKNFKGNNIYEKRKDSKESCPAL